MPPIPPATCLDPRELAEARETPIFGAANIPLSEIALRTHELPPSPGAILIAAEPELAHSTADWLLTKGRVCKIVEYCFAPATTPPGRLWAPNALLEEAVSARRPGRALDLACGSGRDAVYLAAAGWQVDAIDILPDAIARARLTAERFGCADRIAWHAEDLRCFSPQGPFDLVLMAFYFDPAVLVRTLEALGPAALLLIETFTPTHRAIHAKPRNPARALAADDLPALLPGFRILRSEEAWRDGRHTVRIAAEKYSN